MRHSLKKIGLFPAIILIISPIIFSLDGCSNNNYEGGNLPESFSWAYGSWTIEDTYTKREEWEPEKVKHFCLIGKDYIQIMWDGFLEQFSFPYIELMPKSEYTVSYDNPFEDNHNNDNETDIDKEELVLNYSGKNGYDAYLFLNRKKKTISTSNPKDFEKYGIINKISRNKKKPSKAVLAEYENSKTSCPIVGDWQNTRDRRDKETIEEERFMDSFVLRKDGTWVDYFGDYEYTYDAQNDRIKRTYPDSDTPTPVIETFKRYDAEQERIYELTRILTSKAFSYMENSVYSNTTVLHEYRFRSNGGGTSAVYEVQPYGRRQISNNQITWEIVGDEVRVRDKQLSGYSSFVIKKGLFSNYLEETSSGRVYD